MRRCRLVYKSIAYPETLAPDKLEFLAKQSAENNKETDITGLLLLTGNQFLQVLEGPVKFVNQLFIKIARDDRHHDVELVTYEDIAVKCFHDWSMRLVDLSELDETQKNLMLRKYPSHDDVITLPQDGMLIHSLLIDAKNLLLAAEV